MKQLDKLINGLRETDGPTLDKRVRRAVTGFSSLGIGKGDRIAILMRNDLAQLEATLAAQHLGAYPVQINWHATRDEIAHVVKDCDARLLVCHADLYRVAIDRLPPGLPVIGVEPGPDIAASHHIGADQLKLPPTMLEWESWLGSHAPIDTPAVPAVESIIYTSGTTGMPKGVRRFAPTDEQVRLTERMRLAVTGITADSRVLVPAPLYHTAPNLFALRAVRMARLLVLPTRCDPVGLLQDIERHRITHLYLVPTIFVRLLHLPADVRAKFDLSSLSFVLHAGGPCAPKVKQDMLDWWGPIIHEYYGSTEAGPSTFAHGDEWLARPGTVGRAIEGVRMEVHGANGDRLGAFGVGELLVRNDGYADFSYLNREAARAELQQGDLMLTGDMGYHDEDGYFFLVDRKRDLVISGGVNIYPAEIEAAIQSIPGVADCAVFGIPDDEFGEALAAIVQPLPGASLSAADITAPLSTAIAKFKLPRVIEIVAALPREDSGKIKKRLLREPYWTAAGRQI